MANATPRPLYPGERPGTHCMGGWVGHRAGLRKISPPTGFDSRTVQPVASRWAISALSECTQLNWVYVPVTFYYWDMKYKNVSCVFHVRRVGRRGRAEFYWEYVFENGYLEIREGRRLSLGHKWVKLNAMSMKSQVPWLMEMLGVCESFGLLVVGSVWWVSSCRTERAACRHGTRSPVYSVYPDWLVLVGGTA